MHIRSLLLGSILSQVAFMPDFSALLSKPTDEIKKPKPMPEGSYLFMITKTEFREADTPKDKENPKKPVCTLTLRYNEALDDVDAADLAESLNGEPITGKTTNYDLWLTNDAQYRVVELAASLGIQTENTTLGQIIPELVNQVVLGTVVKVQSKKPGQEETFYSNVSSIVGQAA